MPTTTGSFISLSKTVTDSLQPFTTTDVFFYEVNIHVKDQDILYGTSGNTETAKAGSVISFPKGNLRDLYIQNATAGQTATVGIVGTGPNPRTLIPTRY